MPRRKNSLYSLPKFKLKQKTVISVASFVAIILGLLSVASFVSPSEYVSFWREFLMENIGYTAIFSPLLFFVIAFVLHRVRWRIGQMNVLVGLVTMMIAITGLLGVASDSAGGLLGLFIWQTLQNIHPVVGFLILILCLGIGLVVLLDTSISEVASTVGKSKGAFTAVGSLSSKAAGALKRKKDFDKDLGNIKISGIEERGARGKAVSPAREMVMAETIVQNMAGQTKIWKYPPVSLLSDKSGAPADRGDVKKNASIIEKTLDSFGIQARVAEVNGGPAVTQYALEIAQGTKIAKIANLQHDLALALATRTGTVRIEAPIPGKSLVGIEVPNHTLEVVTLKSVIASDEMKKHKSRMAVTLGKDTGSHPVIVDIDRMPHVLVAGTTGSGKSVLMHQWITSLIFRNSPDELKLILIDPKRVEMSQYNGIPHLLAPVIVEPEKILSALKWAMAEMDRRYKLFQSVGVRNIQSYNDMSGFQALPYIAIFIDELADLMMFAPVEVEDAITRLAQLARATGLHLVVATQRPSVDVITGLMKANIPARIAFNVSSMIDSRVIIDGPGAEKLLGRGDMLFMSPDASKPVRVQGVFVSDPEINGLVKFLKESGIGPEYSAEVTEMPIGKIGKGTGAGMGGGGADDRDDLFEEAVRTVCQYDRASASLLQRRLKVGYARAARIIDELEQAGIIGAGDGSKPRDVLMRDPNEYFAASGHGVSAKTSQESY